VRRVRQRRSTSVVQAQVLNLLKRPAAGPGADVHVHQPRPVRREVHERRHVRDAGRASIVEAGPAEGIYAEPREEYTRDLIAAIPRDDLEAIRTRQATRIAAEAARAGV
jgi:peptide/nickel transport system ATP-binding protein